MSDKKVLLAFYSGVGSTRTVAEVLQIKLQNCGNNVDLLDINIETETHNIEQYDYLILGTPTHHCYPPKTISEFIDKIEIQSKPKNIFLFATYVSFRQACMTGSSEGAMSVINIEARRITDGPKVRTDPNTQDRRCHKTI